MSDTRIALALEAGLPLPATGKIAVLGPRAGMDLSALPKDRLVLITRFKPDFQAFAARGYDVATDSEGDFSMALVVLPRAKALARAMLAQVRLVPLVAVDGQKTDGVESVLKELRKRETVQGVISKSHGKLFWFAPGADYADWQGQVQKVDGFLTRPGVFSADKVDAGSALLAQALPPLSGKVADLGAGWGYLSAQTLARSPDVTGLHLVEADLTALDCAQVNVPDARAQFHWADATLWRPDSKLDAVIMTPPFHTGRAAEPDLGRAFIATAAAALAPSGQLWLVANRHLPYEAALAAAFGKVQETGGDNRFKILHAARPSRQGR